MAAPGAVATEANAVAVVNVVTDLATPHALLGVASALFGNTVADRGADLLDPRSGKGGGDMEGRVDVSLEASKGVSLGKTS